MNVYLSNVIKDTNRKSLLIIIKELTFLFLKTRYLPVHYFTRFAYRKGIDYLSFIPNQKFDKYLEKSNSKKHRYLVNDKYVFSEILESFGIPQARNLAVLYNGQINIIDPVKSTLRNQGAYKINDLFDLCNVDTLFIKPVDGEWGSGALILNRTKAGSEINDEKLNSGYWLIQEKVNQHQNLKDINESSLNTIRIDTFLKENGEVEIFSALLRFGKKGSVVDNGSAGGWFIGINSEGLLKKNAFSYLKNGGDLIERHPDSLIRFENMNVPYWPEIKRLVERTALIFPQIRAIGWDIAVTPHGPIIIEANDNYHLGMSETASGGYYKNDIFKRRFEQILSNK